MIFDIALRAISWQNIMDPARAREAREACCACASVCTHTGCHVSVHDMSVSPVLCVLTALTLPSPCISLARVSISHRGRMLAPRPPSHAPAVGDVGI